MIENRRIAGLTPVSVLTGFGLTVIQHFAVLRFFPMAPRFSTFRM
jgi:hypothetical protein